MIPNRPDRRAGWFVAVVLCVVLPLGTQPACSLPPYLDPGLPLEKRVNDLLSQMTLAEKVGQINMPCVYVGGLGRGSEAKMKACRRFAAGQLLEGIGPAGGFFTLANTILPEGPRQQAAFFNELQNIARQKSRLKIPLLQIEEGTHGLMCAGGTIFPEGPALGSAWNPDLIRDIYTIAAREARALGIHALCTLVIEPIRDPRLGRNQEAYSEDPFLCTQYAAAIVHAIQGDDLTAPDKTVAVFCHYPGQSAPESGLERGAMDISQRTLREVFLPPWIAALKQGGALGVMATYPAIDGIPVHASKKILTDLLRRELHFRGLVLSEGSGISTLLYEGLAENQKQAGRLALHVGVDVGISFESAYLNDMIESINDKSVPLSLLDRAVRRILRLKFQLGLFEKALVDPDRAVKVSHTAEHQQLALRAAREGIVLLKNEGNLLPLSKSIKSLAVIGPNADHAKNQLGDYVALNVLQDVVTVLDGLKTKLGSEAKITYVKGCEVVGDELSEIDRARRAAQTAEVAVVVLGENEWRTPNKKGTDGEGYDAATLELTGLQRTLVRAVAATGTPTVVVLINGRPLAIPWIAENVPAILEAWLPGEQGGHAVADVLFGDVNPSGRLPVTFPRHAGQLPVYYNHKPAKTYWLTKGWGKPYVDLDPRPLYEFGFGLSYTTFAYANLRIQPAVISPAGRATVSLDVKNTGSRPGAEVVQLYLNDPLSSVTAPSSP